MTPFWMDATGRVAGGPQATMHDLEPLAAKSRIAYFTMEIALQPEIHTYSGGLGVLAGDTARSCADLELPVVFVTLVSRSVAEQRGAAQDLLAGGGAEENLLVRRRKSSGSDAARLRPRGEFEPMASKTMTGAASLIWIIHAASGRTGRRSPHGTSRAAAVRPRRLRPAGPRWRSLPIRDGDAAPARREGGRASPCGPGA
jgi:hypothetical protein